MTTQTALPPIGTSRTYPTDTQAEGALQKYYHRNPYAALAAATGLGYLVAGGLFTPFTRRMLKIGMRALVIPVAIVQVKKMTEGSDLFS